MSRNKVDELTLDAVRQLQKLAKDQGFKRLPDEQAFMDDLSGEDDGPRIIMRRRFTTLSEAELAKARIWWEGLPEGEQMRRRDDAASRREAFGIELPGVCCRRVQNSTLSPPVTVSATCIRR